MQIVLRPEELEELRSYQRNSIGIPYIKVTGIGGLTKVRAGAKLPKSHCRLRGATPAIVPNRPLGAGDFVDIPDCI